MTMIFDLSLDLLEEILSRVLITSLGAVRSTCKLWNALSKDRILCKEKLKIGFMMMNYRLCSMRLNLNEGSEEFVDISKFPVSVSQVYYCDGLLLCITKEKISRLVVWNPYLGQTRWIQPKTTTESITRSMYALGYDNNKNHKILRLFDNKQDYYEIYDFKSSSWRVFNVIPNWDIDNEKLNASVDGNSYFLSTTTKRIVVEGYDSYDIDHEDTVTCFDFTKERFGQSLPLPFQPGLEDTLMLSCVKEKKLAFLNQYFDTLVIEIWITTKIEPNEVLWIPYFLKVDMKPDYDFYLVDYLGTFFIDEEKRVAVVLHIDEYFKTAYIIGENRKLKTMDYGNETEHSTGRIMCFSSYVPSLVQINQIARCERREKKRKRKSKRKEKKRKQTNKKSL